MTAYQIFVKTDNIYQPHAGQAEVFTKLPPGMYAVAYDPMKEMVQFKSFNTSFDSLVSLPGTEFEEIMQDIETFFSEEYRESIKSAGLLNKQNIFLHGKPGTGKSSIVQRIVQEFVKRGGVVLFNPRPDSLSLVYHIFDSTQKETPILIIFEELDTIIYHSEKELLSVLDGETQKENVTFIATTNFIDRIPPRILRPGRFPVVKEVGLLSQAAREAYLVTKVKDSKLAKTIAEKTKDFTIDELKEVVRSAICMKKDLDITIKKIKDSPSRKVDPRDLVDEDDSYDTDELYNKLVKKLSRR